MSKKEKVGALMRESLLELLEQLGDEILQEYDVSLIGYNCEAEIHLWHCFDGGAEATRNILLSELIGEFIESHQEPAEAGEITWLEWMAIELETEAKRCRAAAAKLEKGPPA